MIADYNRNLPVPIPIAKSARELFKESSQAKLNYLIEKMKNILKSDNIYFAETVGEGIKFTKRSAMGINLFYSSNESCCRFVTTLKGSTVYKMIQLIESGKIYAWVIIDGKTIRVRPNMRNVSK
jgi:hypothetical protein